eukprot:1946640-Rhodomonas_salina.5
MSLCWLRTACAVCKVLNCVGGRAGVRVVCEEQAVGGGLHLQYRRRVPGALAARQLPSGSFMHQYGRKLLLRVPEHPPRRRPGEQQPVT